MNKKLFDLTNLAPHKRDNAELNRREFFLRKITEALPVGCYVVDDRTGDIVYFNSLFCDIWGIRHLEEGIRKGTIKNGDIIKHCSLLVVNDSEYRESCLSLQYENNRSTIHDEIHLKDNRVINRLSTQLRDDDDNYWGRLYVFGDITRPKEMERSLKESEETYHQLFFNSPAIKLIVNPVNGEIMDANKAATRFYGYTTSKLQSMTIYDICTENPEAIVRSMQSAKIYGENHFQSKHRLSDGEVRNVEVYSGCVTAVGKEIINCIVFDVTEKIRAEKGLRESRERLSLVIEGAGAGIWDYDMINDRIYYDKQWKAMLGYEENEISDSLEEWRSRLHPDDYDKVYQAGRDLMAGKVDRFQIEHRLRHKDGSYRWILATGKIIFDREKHPLRWVGSNIDITGRRKVEEMLQFTYNLQRKSDFFNDIISGNRAMDKKSMATAKKWGADPLRPLFCCLIKLDETAAQHENDKSELVKPQWPKNDIMALLSDDEDNDDCVLWDNRDCIGVFCRMNDTADEWAGSMQVARRIKDKIRRYAPWISVTIGVSHVHSGLRSLEKSSQEARGAIIAAKCRGPKDGAIVHYRDIGLYQLIATCEMEHTGEYVQKNIGPLIDYDREKEAGFLLTLEVILESNNLKEAAQELYLHHKTLAYRKKRIEEILGTSIDPFETRLALSAAIKLHKVNNLEEG